MSPGTHQLTLTIEPQSNPIAGRIRAANGPETRFEGYVELIAAIERAHERLAVEEPSADSPPQANRSNERRSG